MKLKPILLIILCMLLVGELAALVWFVGNRQSHYADATVPSGSTLLEPSSPTAPPTEAPTEPPTDPPTEAPTEPPTDPPTEAPTEPPVKHYTLSFAGDCTFGSTRQNWSNIHHFIQTIGENYDYPFDNVRHYLEADDFTLINLEGPLTDEHTPAGGKTFVFRGPTAYRQIMTGSSVEAVTLANNHAQDHGQAGYDSTKNVLKEAGITYVEKDSTAIHITDNGLVIGLYAGAFDMREADVRAGIEELRNCGAEIIICAFHWGNEGEFRPTASQELIGRAAIDAGADIVYGHHPHVLQRIEAYNGGYIFYSLGNFSFGGAALPKDYDTALVQVEVLQEDGKAAQLGELTIIPCSISSMEYQNNFQPTPLEPGAIYDRVLSKLDGSYTGPNYTIDY